MVFEPSSLSSNSLQFYFRSSHACVIQEKKIMRAQISAPYDLILTLTVELLLSKQIGIVGLDLENYLKRYPTQITHCNSIGELPQDVL